MRRLTLFILAVLISANVSFSQDWLTDFSEAKVIAAKENKKIVLVFQGSDWCAPCIKLDREIWSTEIFKKYAQSNYVMLQADFPRKRKNGLSKEQVKANAALAERYNKSSVFPFVVILDEEGNVLGETSYKSMSPQAYIEELNNFIK